MPKSKFVDFKAVKAAITTEQVLEHYPSWAFQPPLIAYLGYHPFTDPTFGSSIGNEPSCVAFFHLMPLLLGVKR
jgi:hypothetical protein